MSNASPSAGRPAAPAYMTQLDGLRALAVLAVVYSHAVPDSSLGRYVPFGRWGVQLFFVLSGFLITQILTRAADDARRTPRRTILKGFVARRSLRIWPLYYMSLLVLAAFNWGRMKPEILWDLAYLSNVYQAKVDAWTGLTAHYWSLAVEEQFYLVWPVVLLLVSKRARLPVALLMSAIGPAFRLWMGLRGDGDTVGAYVLLPAHLDSLGFGAVLALVLDLDRAHSGRRVKAWCTALFWIAVPCLVVWQIMVVRSGPSPRVAMTQTIAGCVGVAIVALASFGVSGTTGRLLDNSLLRWIGRVSYGVYVLHVMVLHGLIGAFERLNLFPNPHIMFVGASAISCVAAGLSWRFFESPINNLKKHFDYHGGAASASQPSTDGLAAAPIVAAKESPKRRFTPARALFALLAVAPVTLAPMGLGTADEPWAVETIGKLALFSVLAIVGVIAAGDRLRSRDRRAGQVFLAFCAYSLFVSGTGLNPMSGMTAGTSFFLAAVGAMAFASLVTPQQLLEQFARSSAVVTLAGFIVHVAYGPFIPDLGLWGGGRFSGLTIHPNSAGQTAVIGILGGLLAWNAMPVRQRGPLLLVNACGLIASQSRTAALVFLVVGGYLLLTRGGVRKFAMVGCALVMAFAVAMAATDGGVTTAATREGASTEELRTATGRTEIWSNSISRSLDRPLVGVGLGGTAEVLAEQHRKGDLGEFAAHAHNTLIQTWLSTGLLGVALLATSLILFFRSDGRTRAGAIIAAAIIVGTLSESLVAGFPSTYFVALCAALAAMDGERPGVGASKPLARATPHAARPAIQPA